MFAVSDRNVLWVPVRVKILTSDIATQDCRNDRDGKMTEKKLKYNSKIPTVMWLPPQYAK